MVAWVVSVWPGPPTHQDGRTRAQGNLGWVQGIRGTGNAKTQRVQADRGLVGRTVGHVPPCRVREGETTSCPYRLTGTTCSGLPWCSVLHTPRGHHWNLQNNPCRSMDTLFSTAFCAIPHLSAATCISCKGSQMMNGAKQRLIAPAV